MTRLLLKWIQAAARFRWLLDSGSHGAHLKRPRNTMLRFLTFSRARLRSIPIPMSFGSKRLGTFPSDSLCSQKRRATDPVSAFGGIIGFNRTVTEDAARAIGETFFEAIAAPDYAPAALAVLASKKNLRVMRVRAAADRANVFDLRVISDNGMLV